MKKRFLTPFSLDVDELRRALAVVAAQQGEEWICDEARRLLLLRLIELDPDSPAIDAHVAAFADPLLRIELEAQRPGADAEALCAAFLARLPAVLEEEAARRIDAVVEALLELRPDEPPLALGVAAAFGALAPEALDAWLPALHRIGGDGLLEVLLRTGPTCPPE